MRLLQANPDDVPLARADGRARAGEQILARKSLGCSGNSAHVILMLRLASPQASRTRTSRAHGIPFRTKEGPHTPRRSLPVNITQPSPIAIVPAGYLVSFHAACR